MSISVVSPGFIKVVSHSHSGVLLRMVRAHPLAAYFVTAYSLSWIVWSPYVLSDTGLGVLPIQLPGIYIALGAFIGPCLAGFLMTAAMGGKSGLHQLARRFTLWRVGLVWYAFAVIAVPSVALLGALALPGALASITPTSFAATVLSYPFVLAFAFLIDGGGEEPGWRGFALPRLQASHGPLAATLLLGLLWAGWHLPLVLTTAYGGGPGGSVIAELEAACLFVPGVVFPAIVITWIFNNTRGSLLLAMLVHGAFDATPLPPAVVQALSAQYHPLLPPIIGVGVLALVIIVATRGRLSYDRYQREMHALP